MIALVLLILIVGALIVGTTCLVLGIYVALRPTIARRRPLAIGLIGFSIVMFGTIATLFVWAMVAYFAMA